MNKARKKLIEVSIPLEAINVASAREKSIRHGHPSTLHLWWARRPLAACRAVLFAQLVDDPSAWPKRFPTEEGQDAERRRLHKIIERMVPWEASNDAAILNEARWEIARSVAWGLGEEPPPKADGKAILDYLQTKAPPVYDPFCGGGSIPLEAQRLGLRAYGSDLNPVAVLISKALVEIPPKFAGLPPVNPKAQAERKRGGHWNGRGAQGLAEDVRYYGQWIRDEAEKRIGQLYPKAKLPDGSAATVIAWLWARTVRSPDPAANGAMVPLVSTFMLSTKEGKKAWIEPVLDARSLDGWHFRVRTGLLIKSDEERVKLGTKSAKGQAFVCLLSGTPIDRRYIQAEGKADRLGKRLMALVVESGRGRAFLDPAPDHSTIALSAAEWPIVDEARSSFLSAPTPTRAMITGGVCSAYGLRTYGHLFTDRQIVALTTFSNLATRVRESVLGAARSAGLVDDAVRIDAGGAGAAAYADAIATYAALTVSRSASMWSSNCWWQPTGGFIAQVFTRQALPMVWDFAECNVFSGSTGNWTGALDWIARVLTELPATSPSVIANLDASIAMRDETFAVVNTDPPYYDNIGYADLSDFYYLWLRQSCSKIYPDQFRRLVTDKEKELVATRYRHGGQQQADKYFLDGMSKVLSAINSSERREPIIVYYAFKQSEEVEAGIISPGWASFLQAVCDAGLAIDGTWPVRTERQSGVRTLANMLASSIVLVCRKRDTKSSIVTRAEFIRALKKDMPDAIDDIRTAGVGPVDMQQSVIGPGMGIFTRYGKVLENDDSPMSVKTALSLINRVWEEIENELDAAFDAPTQVAIAWFATYGFDTRGSGELIGLANAKNIPLGALFSSGVFTDLHGKAALTPRSDLPADWSPAGDAMVTIWACLQHTVRVLNAPDGGGEAAAKLVAQMGPKSADARALAYRLYEISSQKGWASEALVYNELAQEWARLEDIAINIASPARTTTTAQGAFAFDEGAA